jgi:hypothetical protein
MRTSIGTSPQSNSAVGAALASESAHDGLGRWVGCRWIPLRLIHLEVGCCTGARRRGGANRTGIKILQPWER